MGLLFISHSSEDNHAALTCKALLHARGFEAVFLDLDPEHGIPGGRKWEEELYAQLRRADAVVFLASPDSLDSVWCRVEVFLARSVDKPVFPVTIQAMARPSFLADTQWIDFAGDADATVERLTSALQRAGLGPGDSFAWNEDRSPYPGLDAFAPEDAAVFFGRGPEVEQVLNLLHPTLERGAGRFVAVVGPSGSGKSSLVNAGVLPRLSRQGRRWTILPVVVPGTDPTERLARSLQLAFAGSGLELSRAELTRTLTAGPGGLVPLAKDLRDRQDTNGVLLVIDQAEELLTRTDAARRAAFFELIDRSLRDGSPLWVLATVRSDFGAGSSSDQKISELIDDSILIEPLSRRRMPKVIEGPAQRAGIQFAPGLVQKMIEDTAGGDALPLLAYTLQQLYEHKPPSGLIGDEDYEHVGGVIGALRQRADRVLDELSRRGRGELALPVLVKLAAIERDGKFTRQRVLRATLSEAENDIADAFLAARLLKADGNGTEATVEVAHEALLRGWKPLQAALTESREVIRQRTELERRAEDWEKSGRASSDLLRGERLRAAADRYGQLPLRAQRLIDASRRAARNSVRLRQGVTVVLAALAVAASTLAVIAFQQTATANNQRNQAIQNQIVAEAEQVSATDPGLAAQLLATAYRMGATQDLESRLVNAGQQPLSTAGVVSEGIYTETLSPDGKILATGDGRGQVTLWDVSKPSRPVRLGHPFTAISRQTLASVTFSPDGKTLAVGGGSGSVALWDVSDPGRPSRLGPPIADAGGNTTAWIAFSPDGKTIAVGGGTGSEGEDGDLALWTVRDPAHPVQVGPSLHFGYGSNLLYGNTVVAATFSPDGKTLAIGTYDGSVTLWNSSHPDRLAQVGQSFSPVQGVAVASVAFSPDGSTLAVGNGGNNDGGNGTVTLWDVGNPAQATRLGQPIQLDADNPANGTSVRRVAFSPDGSTLAIGTGDGVVSLWNVTTPGQTAQLGQPLAIGGENEVNTMLFGAGGRTLTVGGGTGTVTRWTLPVTILPGATQDNIPPVEAAASNQGGTILAVGTSDGFVALWNLGDQARPVRIGRPLIADNGDPVESLALTRDGRILAVGTHDGLVTLWNVSKPAQPARLGPAIRVTDGHGDPVSSVALNPAGTTLTVATAYGEVALYNVSDPRQPVPYHPTLGTSGDTLLGTAAFSPDGTIVALADGVDVSNKTASVGKVTLWEVSNPTQPVRLGSPFPGAADVMTFSPNGTILAMTLDTGQVELWNMTNPRHPVKISQPASNNISGGWLAFSPDGKTLAVGNGATITLRGINRQGQLSPVRLTLTTSNNSPVSAMAFGAGSVTLTASEGSGVIQVWNLSAEGAINRICAATAGTLTAAQWRKYVPAELTYDPPCGS